jgi:hypothetical protein
MHFRSPLSHKIFGSNKTIYFYPGNFHIFRNSSLLTEGHTREILCSLLHFEALTLLPNLYYGPKQTLDQWPRYGLYLVLCAVKRNCKMREMWHGTVHSGCFESTTQRQDFVRWNRWEACTHTKQITTKKYVNCILLFRNKYRGLCEYSKSGI